MRIDWRALCGPALATATALIAIGVDRTLVAVPNPAPLFVCIVALAASLSGLASGMISAAIAVIFSALFFLNHRATAGYDRIAVIFSALFFLNHRATAGYDPADLVRLLMLATTAPATAAITGLLRKRL